MYRCPAYNTSNNNGSGLEFVNAGGVFGASDKWLIGALYEPLEAVDRNTHYPLSLVSDTPAGSGEADDYIRLRIENMVTGDADELGCGKVNAYKANASIGASSGWGAWTVNPTGQPLPASVNQRVILGIGWDGTKLYGYIGPSKYSEFSFTPSQTPDWSELDRMRVGTHWPEGYLSTEALWGDVFAIKGDALADQQVRLAILGGMRGRCVLADMASFYSLSVVAYAGLRYPGDLGDFVQAPGGDADCTYHAEGTEGRTGIHEPHLRRRSVNPLMKAAP